MTSRLRCWWNLLFVVAATAGKSCTSGHSSTWTTALDSDVTRTSCTSSFAAYAAHGVSRGSPLTHTHKATLTNPIRTLFSSLARVLSHTRWCSKLLMWHNATASGGHLIRKKDPLSIFVAWPVSQRWWEDARKFLGLSKQKVNRKPKAWWKTFRHALNFGNTKLLITPGIIMDIYMLEIFGQTNGRPWEATFTNPTCIRYPCAGRRMMPFISIFSESVHISLRASSLNNTPKCGALQTRPQVHTEALDTHCMLRLCRAVIVSFILFYINRNTSCKPAGRLSKMTYPLFMRWRALRCCWSCTPTSILAQTCQKQPHGKRCHGCVWTNRRWREQKRVTFVSRVPCQPLTYANAAFICVIERWWLSALESKAVHLQSASLSDCAIRSVDPSLRLCGSTYLCPCCCLYLFVSVCLADSTLCSFILC